MSLLGIDIGTTGAKVAVFSKSGQILSLHYKEHFLISPQKGWAELDAEQVFENIKHLIRKANEDSQSDPIDAFSISCQGEAIIPVDKDKNALHNAIVTFDSRTEHTYGLLDRKIGRKAIFAITGMPLHPMYSIHKILWIKKNKPSLYKRTYKFLCFEDFVFFKLGLRPVIDYSLAARTMAFDIINKKWSGEILKAAAVDEERLATVAPSATIVGSLEGHMAKPLGFKKEVYAVTGGHDQACGAFGAGIMTQERAMNATGTSDVITPVFDRPFLTKRMLDHNYSCYPYVIKDQYMSISVNLTGGLLLKWYRDHFCFLEAEQAKKEKRSVYEIIDENVDPHPVNIFILPHFVGAGTPYFTSESKGMMIGLDLASDRSKISKAILESSAYDLRLNLETLKSLHIKINEMIAIGGGSKSDIWCKIKASVLNIKIKTLKNSEVASQGAAMLAGIATGQYRSYDDAIQRCVVIDKVYSPDKELFMKYDKRYKIYAKIYKNNKALLKAISKLGNE